MVPNSYTVSLLEDAAELIRGYVDVRDGEDGPRPNSAMLAAGLLEEAIKRLKAAQGGPDSEEWRNVGNGQPLPEANREVLVCHVLGDRLRDEVPKAIDIAALDSKGEWYFPWIGRLAKEQCAPVWVTHWRPLPASPFATNSEGGSNG